jgi:hypothetical protein
MPTSIDHNYYLWAIADKDNKVILGVTKDGIVEVDKIVARDADVKSLNYNINDLDFDNPIDFSDSNSIQIPTPRCAYINITGVTQLPQNKTSEGYIDMKAYLEFWDMQGNYFKKKVLLNAQGNSSLSMPKKNFSIDLCNDDWVGDDTFSMRIGDWVPQDSFHIKAFYTDFFRGIGITGYKLWQQVVDTFDIKDNRPYKYLYTGDYSLNTEDAYFTPNGNGDITKDIDTGALCHPDGFPVIVYLNDEFYGVFAWQLKKHRDNYFMNKNTAEHIHLDGDLGDSFLQGEPIWADFEVRNPKSLYNMDGSKYSEGDELIDSTSSKYDSTNKDHKTSAKVKTYIKNLFSSFATLK